MKKILGVIGSPRRKGNTHLLVESIVKGASDAGAAAGIIFLDEKRIAECDGCHVCWKGKPCAKKDDMNTIYERIAESDALVLGTPIYWYGPAALMKGFLDRFVYFNCPENRAKVRNKSAILAIPFEEEDPKAAELTIAMFEKSLGYLEMRLEGTVLAPGVTKRGEIKKKQVYLNEGYELGKRMIANLG